MLRKLGAMALALWLLVGGAAAAAQKVALLIGNATYAHASNLQGPAGDVSAMKSVLTQLGYEVDVQRDLNRAALGEALLEFGDRARGADTALIFYSGHGMEIRGQNYLIPTDARLRRPGAELVEATPLSLAVDAVARAKRLSLVIVDACRNGAPGAERSGVSKGFAPMPTRPGLAIAFSTAPGAPAWDGTGDLSPYTRALTEAITEAPDLDVRTLLTSLGEDTERYAGAPQTPFTRFGHMPRRNVSLSGGGATPAPAPIAPAQRAQDDLRDLGADVAEARTKGDWGRLRRFGQNFHYGENGKPKDFKAAVRVFRASCEGGDNGACTFLGIMNARGDGVPSNDGRAVELYRRSCDGGDALGCTSLGYMYATGRGLPEDQARAARYYQQGCDAGNGLGCGNLGVKHENGEGVAKDMARAAALYRQGCDAGEPLGCNNLGSFYENGLGGLTKDRAQAVSFYRKSLEFNANYKKAKDNLKRLGETP